MSVPAAPAATAAAVDPRTFPKPLPKDALATLNARVVALLAPNPNPKTSDPVVEQVQALFAAFMKHHAALLFPQKLTEQADNFPSLYCLYYPEGVHCAPVPGTLKDVFSLQLTRAKTHLEEFRDMTTATSESLTQIFLNTFRWQCSYLPQLAGLASTLGLEADFRRVLQTAEEIRLARITDFFQWYLNADPFDNFRYFDSLKEKIDTLFPYASNPAELLRVIEPRLRAVLETEIAEQEGFLDHTDEFPLKVLLTHLTHMQQSFVGLLGNRPDDPLLVRINAFIARVEQKIARSGAAAAAPAAAGED